jgi:hypothetical protein
MNIDIMQLIGSYGFPILACIAMGWYVKYMTDKNREDIKQSREAHKEEMTKITEALNNNTMAVHDLRVMIEKFLEVKDT